MGRPLTRAEQAAQQYLEHARAEYAALNEPWQGYEVDVLTIAGVVSGLGVQVVENLTAGGREFAAFLRADTQLIVVEANHHEHRRRFSVAHEIGHYVMHFDLKAGASGRFHCAPSDMDVAYLPPGSRTSTQQHLFQEWEANLFAAELLMPEKPFLAMFKATRGNKRRLVEQFNVSLRSVEIRLERLAKR